MIDLAQIKILQEPKSIVEEEELNINDEEKEAFDKVVLYCFRAINQCRLISKDGIR